MGEKLLQNARLSFLSVKNQPHTSFYLQNTHYLQSPQEVKLVKCKNNTGTVGGTSLTEKVYNRTEAPGDSAI